MTGNNISRKDSLSPLTGLLSPKQGSVSPKKGSISPEKHSASPKKRTRAKSTSDSDCSPKKRSLQKNDTIYPSPTPDPDTSQPQWSANTIWPRKPWDNSTPVQKTATYDEALRNLNYNITRLRSPSPSKNDQIRKNDELLGSFKTHFAKIVAAELASTVGTPLPKKCHTKWVPAMREFTKVMDRWMWDITTDITSEQGRLCKGLIQLIWEWEFGVLGLKERELEARKKVLRDEAAEMLAKKKAELDVHIAEVDKKVKEMDGCRLATEAALRVQRHWFALHPYPESPDPSPGESESSTEGRSSDEEKSKGDGNTEDRGQCSNGGNRNGVNGNAVNSNVDNGNKINGNYTNRYDTDRNRFKDSSDSGIEANVDEPNGQ